MERKFALFAFRGDPMCSIHVFLNALDMANKGFEVKIILEGEAVKLVPELYDEGSALHNLYQRSLEKGLVEGICKACSQKFGTYELAMQKGLKSLEDMANHAGMARFLKEGYEIITF